VTRLTGRVTGPGGQPLADAAVHFLEGPVPLPDIAQLTAEDGRFDLAAPVAGKYRLRVDAPGFGPETLTIDVHDEPEIKQNIALQGGTSS
jgi:hypothetical protein